MTQEERRRIDKEIEDQLDTTLDMIEKFTTMSESESLSYLSDSIQSISSLLGGQGLGMDVLNMNNLQNMSDQELMDLLERSAGGAGDSSDFGGAAGDLM